MFRIIHQKTAEVGETLTPLGLSPTEFDLLAVVRAYPGTTQQELARHLLFTEANMTYHAMRLSERGLIERTTVGRAKRLSLTSAGVTLMEEALPRVVRFHEQQFRALTSEQLQQFESLLRLMK